MSFKGEISAALGWNWNDGAVDNARLGYAAQLLEGNGAGQAEAVWHAEQQTLPSGTSTTLDLTNLTRTVLDDLHAVTLLSVRALLIVNHGDSEGTLLVGGAASDPWAEPFAAAADQLLVPTDSPLLLANRQTGWNVDDANKNLKLTASGGDVVYSIAVLGTTTASGSGSSSSGA